MKWWAALMACTLALPAWSHDFHAGIAEISFNPRTGSTEVVHTYMSHDVEALLSNVYQRQFDMGDPDDQAVFRQYVERQFWLAGAGKRVPLHWVGMTADTQNVTVYQEAPATTLAQVSTIHDDVMSDFLADQVNTINVKDGAGTHTLTFNRANVEQPIR